MGRDGKEGTRDNKPQGSSRQPAAKRRQTLWETLSALVSPSTLAVDDQFSLLEASRSRQEQESRGKEQDPARSDEGGQGNKQSGEEEQEGREGRFLKPRRVGDTGCGGSDSGGDEESQNDLNAYRVNDPNRLPDPINSSLETNLKRLEVVFRLPDNKDIVLREFTVSLDPPVKAAAYFIDGMSDKNIIDLAILQPLMLLSGKPPAESGQSPAGGQADTLDLAYRRLVPINQVSKARKLPDLVKGVLTGATAILLDGCDQGLVVETKGWEHRSVGEPKQEQVIRGPSEAFSETLRANTAMIRRRLKTPSLMTEFIEVGRFSNQQVAVMYLDGIANPALLAEVRTRLKAIDTDILVDSGSLEQFIEDSPNALFPNILSTERPDRVACFLAEGHVALLLENNPFGLVVPTTFTAMLQTAEDYYLRWPYGTFLRILRVTSYFVALVFPSLYVAATAYHHETIPTDLAMAMAAARETVPFPVMVEVLLMAFSFELITEAATRVPGLIGPTIGIVGALVLGQAAVQAGIISPILVIVIAITALASFTIPNYSLSNSVRILRYIYLLAGSVLGFYGIALVFYVDVAHLSVQRSFGVPMLNPVAPTKKGAGDVIVRSPVFTQERRPAYLYPQKRKRQPERVRTWFRRGGDRRG